MPGSYVFLVSCSDCTISGCAFTNCSLYLEWATTNYVCYNQFTDTSVAITSVAYYSHVDNNTFCGLNASLTKDSETEASGNTFNSTCLGEQANPNVASVVFWASLGTAAGVILGIAALIIRKKKKQIIKNTEYSCDKTENNTQLDQDISGGSRDTTESLSEGEEIKRFERLPQNVIEENCAQMAKEAAAQSLAEHYVFAARLYGAAATLASSVGQRDRASFYRQNSAKMQERRGKKGIVTPGTRQSNGIL